MEAERHSVDWWEAEKQEEAFGGQRTALGDIVGLDAASAV